MYHQIFAMLVDLTEDHVLDHYITSQSYFTNVIWVKVCLCPATIMLIMCCISLFQTKMEFWLTLPFGPKGGKACEKLSQLVLAEWLTELSKKQKREKQLPAETVWSLIERLLEVRPDVRDMPEIAYSHCQTFLSETQCHRIGDISKQFPAVGQSSCNTIQIWAAALG